MDRGEGTGRAAAESHKSHAHARVLGRRRSTWRRRTCRHASPVEVESRCL